MKTQLDSFRNRIKDATVGPPVADTIQKVVSLDDGRELGAGEVGELMVYGPQVMLGYWQRPEETAEALAKPRAARGRPVRSCQLPAPAGPGWARARAGGRCPARRPCGWRVRGSWARE